MAQSHAIVVCFTLLGCIARGCGQLVASKMCGCTGYAAVTCTDVVQREVSAPTAVLQAVPFDLKSGHSDPKSQAERVSQSRFLCYCLNANRIGTPDPLGLCQLDSDDMMR